MLLRHGLRALQLFLGVACLFAMYTGVAPALNRTSLIDVQVPPISAPPERDASPERNAAITTRNLFRATVAAPASPVEEELRESQLRLRLCGTYSSSSPAASIACIEDQGTQKRGAYKVDDEIQPGVKLVAVERRMAVIDNRGVREKLEMEESALARTVSAPVARPPARAAARPSESLRERLDELRRRQDVVESAKPKIQQALESAQFAPAIDDSGNIVGIKVSGAKPGGAFEGMSDGTICDQINGVPLTGMPQLAQGVMTMGPGQTCMRCRDPQGQEFSRCM